MTKAQPTGSDKLDVTIASEGTVSRVDDKSFELEVANLKNGGHVYERNIRMKEHRNPVYCYTLNCLKVK